MSLYDTVRANVDKSGGEERVEVNQRALIDKILARYASAGAVYRELLQNSNDAEATIAEISFTTTTKPDDESSSATTTTSGIRRTNNIVSQVQYRNNGMPFRPQDWARLKKIAEGNPDESKIGAFGVGAYTMFSICEEPIVLSGDQALAFVWKGDALWTKTIDNDNGNKNKGWTTFILPSRDPYPLPDLREFGEFLCASLTFTKCLKEIRLFVDGKLRLTIIKTQIQEPTPVQIQKSSKWWKSDGAATASPSGLFTLKDENSLLESFYHVQVTLDDDIAAVTARYVSAIAKTKVPATMSHRMERVTKKKPPSKVEVQIFLNGQQQVDETQSRKNRAYQIVQSFSPRIGEGRIFIGFRTSQTTGLAAHLAAPFIPTVEREAMDLQDQTLRLFNTELLEFSGILMRLTLEHGMSTLGEQYAKGVVERAKLEERLLKEEEEKVKKSSSSGKAVAQQQDQENEKTLESQESTEDDGSAKASSVWGFAKFMAKGVKKTIVKVVKQVEEMVDDGVELLHPLDPRPLCAEEHQAILLMQSFCPRQSTPDPMVGTVLAQGFSRCLPEKAPPVLTRTSVVPGDQARLPNKGMEAFCKDGVVRSLVYQNAEEYHNVIAQCGPLTLNDLSEKLANDVLEEKILVRFLKWWVRFSKSQQYISPSRSLEIKDRIQFFMEYKNEATADAMPVFRLRDFLFYLDEDKIRVGNGFSLDTLPMPDSIIPKVIQDKVTFRTITDNTLEAWFEPLPIEIWIEFISHHPCITSGQPEAEKLRLQVLSTLAQEFSRRSSSEQIRFGNFCEGILREKRCLPFDSTEPTAYSAEKPSNLYLSSAELKAFDGIGDFHKVSESLTQIGVRDDFLLALGVRKSVAIDFLFGHLDTLKWSSDPKPLVEYLRSATLTNADQRKLKSTQYLPAENDVSRMFAPSELYLPDRDLRIFPILRLLQWPSGDEVSERSANGAFLVGLGMGVLPPLVQILKYIANDVDEDTMRVKCLEFVTKRLGSRGAYHDDYERVSRTDKMNLKIVPCVLKSPLSGKEKKGLYSVLGCCADERCAVMGFPVIDPELGETGKLFGSLFKCYKEPDQNSLLKQLLYLVDAAKKLVKTSPAAERKTHSATIVESFIKIFSYLSSRTSDIGSSAMASLEKHEFIPVIVDGEAQWFQPESVFFKSAEPEGESITESLFHSVDFSPFLAAAGVKQEASTKDIFRLMIQNPQKVLRAVGSEEKYRIFLRRVAAHRPFRRVTAEIKDSPFLLAYTVTEDSSDSSKYELTKAKDIFIIDNSFFGRMFPVKHAPHESDLEDFYALIGAKYISKEVNKKYDVIGTSRPDTALTKALLERISERSPLLVSPSVTSRPLVPQAQQILDAKHLEVYEASDLKAVYSLGKSVRTQRTTCCSQPGLFNNSSLYVTADFDWFDVGYAIGEMILQRCQLEDAFFISSLLEAPLDQLRARGFPVDRIIKPEPIPEPEPPKKVEQPTSNRAEEGHGSAPTASAAARVPSAPTQDVDSSANGKDSTGTAEGGGSSEKWPASKASSAADSTKTNAEPPVSKDGYIEILKQMYPDADEDFLHNRLGQNPSLDGVRSLAEEMAASGYPKDSSRSTDAAASEPPQKTETPQEETKPSKFFGSKKLGRAFNGLRASAGGAGKSTSASAPPTDHKGGRGNMPATPESDATSHSNMERMLEESIARSATVDSNGVRAPETTLSIPEGLERGSTCEVIPGQDLKPFSAPGSKNGMTHNSIKIFSSRKHQSSEVFLRTHSDAVESFAVVLERLCGVFGLPLSTIAIFHDPTGGTIAFNSNRSLHFNVRFFFGLHYAQNLHQSRTCYSYWYVTFAHELAHHMAPGHNVEHGFYTESYCTLYLPKLMTLLSQLAE